MWRRFYAILGILTSLWSFCFLANCDDTEEDEEKIRILIVSGGASHDFSSQLEILKLGLEERIREPIEWIVRLENSGRSDIGPGYFREGWASEADLVIHLHCFPRVGDPEFVARVLQPHRSGTPALVLHGALQSFRTSNRRWFEFCGVETTSHASSADVEVKVLRTDHPVAVAKDPWTSPREELYFVDEVESGTTVLAEGRKIEEAANRERDPVVWVHEYGPANARVFASSLGNDAAGLSVPAFLDMAARGLLWALRKEESDFFVHVAPEDSLAGLAETKKPRRFLNHGVSILQHGISEAMSEDIAGGHMAEFALDGRGDTYWRAATPGPSVWEVSLEDSAEVSALAIEWLEEQPQEYLVEGSSDLVRWSILGKGGGDLNGVLRSLHHFPAQALRNVRVSIPTTRPGEHPGIREISGYQSRNDIPAALALEAGLSDGLRSVSLPDSAKSLRLHPDWELEPTVTPIPAGLSPVELVECADGSMFLLAEGADSKRQILHFAGGSPATVFLGELSQSSSMTWDGEWIYLLEDLQLSKFRDTNEDGAADERRRIGALTSAGGDVSPSISKMQLAIDGWIYAVSESSEGRGVVRFRRDGSGLQEFVSSKNSIVSFRALGDLAFEAMSRKGTGALDVRLVRHGAFPGRPLESFPHLSGQELTFESNGDFAFALQAEEKSELILEVPGLQSVFAVESGLMPMIEEGGDTFALRLKPASGDERNAPVDLDRIPDLELFPLFSSSSPSVQREAVFEVQRRRGDLEEQAIALLQDRQSRSYLPSLALLSQIDGEKAFAILSDAARLSHQAIAYRLLGDREEARNHRVFAEITRATDPEVTAEILAAIVRSESDLKGLEELVLAFAAVEEEELSRTAIEWLVLVGKEVPRVCFAMIDNPDANPRKRDAAFSVLARFADPGVVKELSRRLTKAESPKARRQYLHALCLIHKEEGKEWAGSAEVAEILQVALRDGRVDTVWLLDQMLERSIPIGDLTDLASLAATQFPLQAALVNLMTQENEVPPSAIQWLEDLVAEKSHDPSLRAKAASLLNRSLSFSEMYRLSSELLEASLVPESEKLLLDSWQSRDDLGERVSLLSFKLKSGTASEQKLAERVLNSFGESSANPESGNLAAADIYELGFDVFSRHRCNRCHNIHGEGDFVGPDLVAWMRENRADSLATALREPGKRVRKDFRPEVIEVEPGSRLRGLVTNATENEFEVVDEAGNRIVLDPKQVISRQPETGSLMPAFSEQSISEEEKEALIHFLRELGRFSEGK